MEPEAQARDSGEVDLVVQGGGHLEEPPDLLHIEDGGETVGGWRTEECKGVPVAFEEVLREEADATGADAHGRWGEAVDIFAVQEVVLQLLLLSAATLKNPGCHGLNVRSSPQGEGVRVRREMIRSE